MSRSLLDVTAYKDIPKYPGVYKYYDSDMNLIYVGKAKNLNSRVSSYFKGRHDACSKTYKLVEHIRYIEFIVVNSEHEALLLENNLIKQYRPRYNVLLKDSKTYPYIVLTDEEYPRFIVTERLPERYGCFFGPFSDRSMMNDIVEMIKSLYHIRTCKLSLTTDGIQGGKYVECLEYHLGNCGGVCQNRISKRDYSDACNMAVVFLKGDFVCARKRLKRLMMQAAKDMNFKSAQRYKDQLKSLYNYTSKSIISNPKNKDFDVFVVDNNSGDVFVCYMIISGGMLIFIDKNRFEVSENVDEACVSILAQYKEKHNRMYTSTLTNIKIDYPRCITPKIGDKTKFIDIGQKNITALKHEIKVQRTMQLDYASILILMKDMLSLNRIPYHIECFDNSNLQGTNPVSSCVVFRNGQESRSEYRHFHVKTVIGANDYKTMKEIVSRRYTNNNDLPDLIIIDGGIEQLHAVVSVLKNMSILEGLDVISLAKKQEEIFIHGDDASLLLPRDSRVLRLIQHIRDEAHRFAISFHRRIRSKRLIPRCD